MSNEIIGANDIDMIKSDLSKMPVLWEGKACVLELKEADYNWRQMEWWAFYFEHKFQSIFKSTFQFPGEKYERVHFDMKGEINWDLKAKAIKSDDHKVILNDRAAMEDSIARHGFHGEIIALCDVEYNDINRSFQRWHSELKGGLSKYEKERKQRTSVSRYRKTKAELTEILFVIFTSNDLSKLSIMKQGRNSNGKPRPEKYMLDLETIDQFYFEKYEF